MATRKRARTPRRAGRVVAATNGSGRLLPPAGGAVVRMYRIGHGDCFLIAFAGDADAAVDEPTYVLVDCGYKPGSPAHIQTSLKEIGDDLRAATGGRIDVAVVTHEHQDHVNGIKAATFAGIEIGESWFAWTEDPEDDLANDLRRKFKDKLLGLLAARNRIAFGGPSERVRRIDELLSFELGGDDESFQAAGADPANSRNKQAMKLLKDAARRVRYLRPHGAILPLPGAPGVRVFTLGPPRDLELLASLDPQTGEDFHADALALGSVGGYFAAAARAADGAGVREAPFPSRYCIGWEEATVDGAKRDNFFARHYGRAEEPESPPPQPYEAPSNPSWRRIDFDWLFSAEQLALDMNDQTNNSSLVLAFELGKGGKVLLFAADAQRGNWVSWARKTWRDGTRRITARDLLSRTVLYKVGHHGSHNATLNGRPEDEVANLSWMAAGEHAGEFTAMITAVRSWAETQKGWDHPLKAIKDALLKKCSGRVFQTDTDFDAMQRPAGASASGWRAFVERTAGDRLYFDYRIEP